MLDIKIKLPKELPRDLRQFNQVLQRELVLAMEQSVRLVSAEVSRLTPVGVTGDLARGITGTVRVRTEMGSPSIRGLVFPQAIYAIYVEEGTKGPRKAPPRGPIEQWVRRKLGPSLKAATGRKTRRKGGKAFKGSLEETVRSVTFLVQRKIAVRGTRARRMFRKGSRAAEPRVRRIFQQHIDRAVRRMT